MMVRLMSCSVREYRQAGSNRYTRKAEAGRQTDRQTDITNKKGRNINSITEVQHTP